MSGIVATAQGEPSVDGETADGRIDQAWLDERIAKMRGQQMSGGQAPTGEAEASEERSDAAPGEPAESTEPAETPKVTEKDWLVFRKQKKSLKSEQDQLKQRIADLDKRESEMAESRRREQEALETGDVDAYFQERFKMSFNDWTSRYAQQQSNVPPEVRKQIEAQREITEQLRAKQEEIEKRESAAAEAEKSQRADAAVGKALTSGRFGAEAAALAEDPRFVTYARSLADKQIDPDEPPADQAAVFRNIVTSLVEGQKKYFQILQKAFGGATTKADTQDDQAYLGTEQRGESLGSEQRGETLEAEPERSGRTTTLSNRTAPPRKRQKQDLTKIDNFDEFLRIKRLR